MLLPADTSKLLIVFIFLGHIIPEDHRANWPISEIKILANTLRDGVLLCNLIQILDPSLDLKDQYNRKPRDAQVS